MSKIPTPAMLDKKRKEVPTSEDVPMIEYRETKMVDGVQEFKIHRVPLAEWDCYAKENGL